MFPDAVVEEHLRDRRLGLAGGQLELRVLEFDDLLAEGRALLDVVGGERQRPLHHRHRVHRDDQPLLRQFLHELVEALPLLGAEQAFGRQAHVLEEQFRGVG